MLKFTHLNQSLSVKYNVFNFYCLILPYNSMHNIIYKYPYVSDSHILQMNVSVDYKFNFKSFKESLM